MTGSQTHPQWFLAPYCIGAKLRSLRLEKRLTLARLAVETGLSTALLSKLETDRMVPALATLATICRVYGVGLGHFFRDPEEHSLAVTRKVATQGQGRNAAKGTRVPLNAGVANRRMEAAMVHLAPGAHAAETQPVYEEAMLVYVLDGQLTLDVGGLRETLGVGDCAYLESRLYAAWSANGPQACRLLTVAARGAQRGDASSSSSSMSMPS